MRGWEIPSPALDVVLDGSSDPTLGNILEGRGCGVGGAGTDVIPPCLDTDQWNVLDDPLLRNRKCLGA